MPKFIVLPIPRAVRTDIEKLYQKFIGRYAIASLGKDVVHIYNILFIQEIEMALEVMLLYGFPSINFHASDHLLNESYHLCDSLDEERVGNRIGELSDADNELTRYVDRMGHDWLFNHQFVAEYLIHALPDFKQLGKILKEFEEDYNNLELIDDIEEVTSVSPTLSTITVRVS